MRLLRHGVRPGPSRREREGYQPIRQIDHLGRGTLFQSFVPQGWSARVLQDDESASFSAAACKGLRLDSPEGALLMFYPFAYFKSFTPGPLGLRKNYSLDPASGVRFRQRPELEQYAGERLSELFGNIRDLRLAPAEDRDGVLKRRTEAFIGEAGKIIKGSLSGEWAKYALSFTLNGGEYSGYFGGGRVFLPGSAGEAEPQQEQPKSSPGRKGGFLEKAMNYKGILGGPSINDMTRGGSAGLGSLGELGSKLGGGLTALLSPADWARVFDFILVCPGGDPRALEGSFDDFCRCLQYGALYYSLQDEEMAQVRQIQMQGAMQRQQIAMNAQRELHRTQSQTSDIINSGYRDRSRRMDNARQSCSEAVRGVNSYVNSYGQTVEADVKYERVYQRGDSYAGATEKGADPGYEWQELKKR